MKKTWTAILAIVLTLGVFGTGYWLIKKGSPEYALKETIDDIHEKGADGLKEHVTDSLKGKIELIQMISDNPLVSYVLDQLSDEQAVEVLLAGIQEIDWKVDDVMRSQKQAEVIMRFSWKDKMTGTIPIKMIRDSGTWKISGIGIPNIESVFSSEA